MSVSVSRSERVSENGLETCLGDYRLSFEVDSPLLERIRNGLDYDSPSSSSTGFSAMMRRPLMFMGRMAGISEVHKSLTSCVCPCCIGMDVRGM